MLHRNLYLENADLWEEVKKQAFLEKKGVSSFIEEILTYALSEKKDKALTPEKVAFYIKKKYVKGQKITEFEISHGACGDVWISKRRMKTIMDDLILNRVILEVANPTNKKVRYFEVM